MNMRNPNDKKLNKDTITFCDTEFMQIGEKGIVIEDKEYKNCKIVKQEDSYYAISDKAVLTINATGYCNAKCKFCYNHITFHSMNNYINYTDKKFNKLLELCEKANVKIVSISGGEPTINPLKLVETIDYLKGRFSFMRLHTNGYKLMDEIDFKGKKGYLFQHLKELGVNDISLSVAHYDLNKNQEIMNYSGDFKGVTGNQIREINKVIPVRLSCFINSEGITSNYDIESYLNWGIENSVEKFVFRFASRIPKEFCANTDFTKFNNDNKRRVGLHVKHLLSIGYNIKYCHLKSDSHIYILEKDNILIDISSSSEELDEDQKIRRLIYMQDGNIYTSWIDKDAILEF